MLAAAVRGVELGEHDRRVLAWAGTWEGPTLCTLASLIVRGRAVRPEASARRLRAELAAVLADVESVLDDADANERKALERTAARLGMLCGVGAFSLAPGRLPTGESPDPPTMAE